MFFLFTRMSAQQKHVLVWLLDCRNEGHADEQGGVPWRVGGAPDIRASLSRALRRLEQRSLVRRRNRISGDQWDEGDFDRTPPVNHRTTHVELTQIGEVVAKHLKKAMGRERR